MLDYDTDGILKLAGEVTDLSNLRTEAETLKGLREFLVELRALENKVERIRGWSEHLVPLLDGLDEEEMRQVEERIRELVGLCESQLRSGVSDVAVTYKRFVRNMEDTMAPIQTAVLGAWRRQVDQRFSGSRTLLPMLAGVRAFDHLRLELQTQVERINRLKSSAPSAEEEVEVYQDALATETRLGEKLSEAGFNPGVVLFLADLSQGSVTLETLTDEVWAWLRKNGLLSSIHLSFGR